MLAATVRAQSDQAEDKSELADDDAREDERKKKSIAVRSIRAHQKLFLFDQNVDQMLRSAGQGEQVLLNGSFSSAFVTIEDVLVDGKMRQGNDEEPLRELRCAASNELGEQASDPIVFEAAAAAAVASVQVAQVECRVDDQLAAMRAAEAIKRISNVSIRGNSNDDDDNDESILSQLEVHQLERGWPSDDKFRCNLERENDDVSSAKESRFDWTFVPFDEVPERLAGLRTWPTDESLDSLEGSSTNRNDSFHIIETETQELSGAAQKLLLGGGGAGPHKARGLVLCKLTRTSGDRRAQRAPCMILIAGTRASDLSQPDQHQAPSAPSAEGCRIEPILISTSGAPFALRHNRVTTRSESGKQQRRK